MSKMLSVSVISMILSDDVISISFLSIHIFIVAEEIFHFEKKIFIL